VKFEMTKPCADCPFLKEGGIRLRRKRIVEIAGGMLSSNGSTFACHKTVAHGEDDEDVNRDDQQHCAGALIFAEKHQNATQMMRWMERIGLYDARRLMADQMVVASVFDSLRQMLATAIGPGGKR
jgi:hypothetical protein